MWTSECLSAFNAAKDLLCTAPVLSAPKFSSPFKLQVDASATGGRSSRSILYFIFLRSFLRPIRITAQLRKKRFALLLALKHFECIWVEVLAPLQSIPIITPWCL